MNPVIRALRELITKHPKELILPLVVFTVVMALGYLARRILMRALAAWNARTQGRNGQILADSLRGPILIWVLILAVHLALQASALPARFTEWSTEPLRVLFIFSVTLMSMRFAGELIRYHGAQIPGAVPVTTLSQTLAQLFVLILGILIILNQLRISITPILTALGVGGLAVALALQDTLSNLFAGFYVAVAGQVRLGDYIKMDGGPEGYVSDISWRSTTIRTLANNLVFVPNSKLAQAIVTNYHLPEKRLPVQLQVSVSYDSDPRQVERVLLEVAGDVAHETPAMLAEPAPSVSWDPGFGDSWLGLSLNYSVPDFVSQYSARDALRRRIFERFRQEGIRMPYPTRTIFLHESRTQSDGAGAQRNEHQSSRPPISADERR
jgi:small-conductance mechanosensitive channel